jgi:predicted FMN-binding regulatory protein PaiB
MAAVPTRYLPATDDAVADLVRAQPLAWIVSGEPGGSQTTPLPVRAELDAGGQVVALIGHFARRNPQVDALKADPRALILFMGPHAYISPSWLTDRTQAPSWNYASAAFEVELAFDEDPAFARMVLDDVIGAMEAGRQRAWSIPEMGERYDRILRGIIPFRATVIAARPAFKLGQDERDDVYAELLAGLEADGEAEMAALMRTHNPGR